MKKHRLNSKEIYTELVVQINSYYKIDDENYIDNLDPSIKINDFINHLKLTRQDWWIILLSLEIDFKIDVPGHCMDNMELTVGDFCKYLSDLPIEKSPHWTLNRINNLMRQLEGYEDELMSFFSTCGYA